MNRIMLRKKLLKNDINVWGQYVYAGGQRFTPGGGGLSRTKTGYIPVMPAGLAQYFAAFNRVNWEAVVWLGIMTDYRARTRVICVSILRDLLAG